MYKNFDVLPVFNYIYKKKHLQSDLLIVLFLVVENMIQILR